MEIESWGEKQLKDKEYFECIKTVITTGPGKTDTKESFTKGKTYPRIPINYMCWTEGKTGFDLILEDNFDDMHCVATADNKEWERDRWFTEHFRRL